MFDTDEAPVGASHWPQPGEVWSLWKMLRAYANEFSQVDRSLLYVLQRLPRTHADELALQTETGKDDWGSWAQERLQAAGFLIHRLPLGPAVTKQLTRTLALFQVPQYKFVDAAVSIDNLYTRFRDEMEDLQFLHITPRLAEGLGEAPPFGPDVEQAFPSASLEIRDAARCLAMGQGTAAVFHCMRALEPVLIALGAKFGVGVKENWNSALNDIETAVRDRDSKKSWPNWKEDEPFYMDAVTHFFIIKNAWRNHTMHLRLRFAESDALSVYDHTRDFMQQLASRLSEDVEGASSGQTV